MSVRWTWSKLLNQRKVSGIPLIVYLIHHTPRSQARGRPSAVPYPELVSRHTNPQLRNDGRDGSNCTHYALLMQVLYIYVCTYKCFRLTVYRQSKLPLFQPWSVIFSTDAALSNIISISLSRQSRLTCIIAITKGKTRSLNLFFNFAVNIHNIYHFFMILW